MIVLLCFREVFEILFCYFWKLIKYRLKRRVNDYRFLSLYFKFYLVYVNLKVIDLI